MAYEVIRRTKVNDYDIEFGNDVMCVYTKDMKLIDTIELNTVLNSNTSEEIFREIIKEYLEK